jgi:hypothetical protein
MKQISCATLFTVVGLLVLSVPAGAHHGDAGRYIDKFVDITGTVVETQLVNPHAILVVDVTDANGKTVRWQAEMGGAQQLIKQGWANDVKSGTKVTMTGRRLKSGAPYLNLTDGGRVTLTDSGKVVMQSN